MGQHQRHFGSDQSVWRDDGEPDNEKEVSNCYGRSNRVGGYRFLCLAAECGTRRIDSEGQLALFG